MAFILDPTATTPDPEEFQQFNYAALSDLDLRDEYHLVLEHIGMCAIDGDDDMSYWKEQLKQIQQVMGVGGESNYYPLTDQESLTYERYLAKADFGRSPDKLAINELVQLQVYAFRFVGLYYKNMSPGIAMWKWLIDRLDKAIEAKMEKMKRRRRTAVKTTTKLELFDVGQQQKFSLTPVMEDCMRNPAKCAMLKV